jgi:hypothetical protein
MLVSIHILLNGQDKKAHFNGQFPVRQNEPLCPAGMIIFHLAVSMQKKSPTRNVMYTTLLSGSIASYFFVTIIN